MEHIVKILKYISASVAIIPMLAAFLNYKHIRDYAWPLFFYLILSLLIEITTFTLDVFHIKGVVVMLLFIYTILEFLLLSLFYSIFFRRIFNPVVFNWMIILFTITATVLSKIFATQRADHYGMAIEAFILICYCLFFYYYTLRHLVFDNLLQSAAFWVNTGILFYFAGNFTIFIFSDYIENHLSGSYAVLWKSIHTFFNVFMNILFTIGFWKLRTK